MFLLHLFELELLTAPCGRESETLFLSSVLILTLKPGSVLFSLNLTSTLFFSFFFKSQITNEVCWWENGCFVRDSTLSDRPAALLCDTKCMFPLNRLPVTSQSQASFHHNMKSEQCLSLKHWSYSWNTVNLHAVSYIT